MRVPPLVHLIVRPSSPPFAITLPFVALRLASPVCNHLRRRGLRARCSMTPRAPVRPSASSIWTSVGAAHCRPSAMHRRAPSRPARRALRTMVPRPEVVVLGRSEGAHDEDRRHRTPVSVANVSAQVLVEPATLLAPAGGRCAGALRRHFKNREPWMTFVLGRFEGARDADWWHRTSISVTDASAQVLVESAHSAPHAAGRRVGALPAISKNADDFMVQVSQIFLSLPTFRIP